MTSGESVEVTPRSKQPSPRKNEKNYSSGAKSMRQKNSFIFTDTEERIVEQKNIGKQTFKVPMHQKALTSKKPKDEK